MQDDIVNTKSVCPPYVLTYMTLFNSEGLNVTTKLLRNKLTNSKLF